MQTFLPYRSIARTAQVLDTKRLGKQRVEAAQIIFTLLNKSSGWQFHPAVRMWDGYLDALRLYHDVMIKEWIRRGFVNTMPVFGIKPPVSLPPWYGDPRLHSSHRAALLYKDYEYYSKFGWAEKPELNYFWPTPYDAKLNTQYREVQP